MVVIHAGYDVGLVEEFLLHEFVDHFLVILELMIQRSLQGTVQDILAGNNTDGTKT